MNKATTIIIALAVAAASFWAGTYYQSRQFMAARLFGAGTMGGAGRGGFQGGPGQMRRFGQGGVRPSGLDNQGPGAGPRDARVISGRLDRLENGKLTLTTAFGSVKVTLDKGAKVKKATASSAADLKVGNQVIIQGVTTDKEGRMTAKSVIGE